MAGRTPPQDTLTPQEDLAEDLENWVASGEPMTGAPRSWAACRLGVTIGNRAGGQ